MKKLICITLVTFLLSGCGGSVTPSAPTAPSDDGASYQQIGMDEAIRIMNEQTGYIILDVRRADEFEAGHIPGAINIPNESIGADEIPELPDKDQMILVYCRSGRRSKVASEKLVKLGYTNIIEFGGILDWPGKTVTGG